MKKFFIGIIILFCGISGWFYINHIRHEPEIYALRYGESLFNEKYIFIKGQDNLVPFIWTFFAVKDNNRIFLIDTGIGNEQFLKLWKINNYISPLELLNRIGINKDDIDGIIITHLHADHVDGLSLFKGIPVYLQHREYNAVSEAFRNTDKKYSNGYYRVHYDLINDAQRNGNLVLIDGKKRISDNITVELEPYHTCGTQTVIVKKGSKYFYFVPDNAYMYRNITELMPVGICYDPAGNLAYLKKLSVFDPSQKIAVPGHDPELFRKFAGNGKPFVKLE